MDVESPKHLERLRDQPEIKAALLREEPAADAAECRFERSARNSAYWPPIEALAASILATGRVEELCQPVTVYERSCWVIATALDPRGPYAVAVTAADGAALEELVTVLRKVTHDYWHGSYFFK
ncbi:MAG: hypothetical protein ACREVG_16250 [Burkholderiales bacterium]